jgi:methionine-rich copper-binding protein CopC
MALVSARLGLGNDLRGDADAPPDLRLRESDEVTMMRPAWFWPLSIALLLLLPVIAWSHAVLVKSAPARRAVLSQPPARIQLWFNERLEAQFSQLTVWDGEGHQVDAQDVQVGTDDAKRLSVGLVDLAPGMYTVKFRVLSVDGHVVEGEFPFTIRGRR